MLLNCGVVESLGLGVPWTARRSNQSILNKINPEYSLEGLIPKLKLQHFDHLMWRTDSLEKTLKLGKIEGRRRRRWQRIRWLDGITNSMDMSLSKLRVGYGQGSLECCSPKNHKEFNMTEQLNWNELGVGDGLGMIYIHLHVLCILFLLLLHQLHLSSSGIRS